MGNVDIVRHAVEEIVSDVLGILRDSSKAGTHAEVEEREHPEPGVTPAC